MALPKPRGAPATLPGMRPPPPVSRNPPPGAAPPGTVRPPPAARPAPTTDPLLLLIRAAGFDDEGNPPPAVMADAGGIVRAAPGMAQSDAGQSPYLYETWWGFCPIVGSFNQMVMGRTSFQKCVGGVFFVADCTLVGGPMIRGMLWGLRATASAGLRLAAKGAGTVLQRESLLQFANMGGKVLARAEAEALITRELAKGHVLLIGAETSKGGVQHSVAYIIEKSTNTIYKLHGGLTQLAKLEAAPLAKATISGTVGRMNTMQVFNLAKSPAQVWAWWSKMAATEAFSSFMRGGMPRGCAGTVVLILERLAGEGAIAGLPKLAGAARWLPMYLDKALGGYVLNATQVYLGTMVTQSGPLVVGITLCRFVTSMVSGGPGRPEGGYQASNILPLDQYAPVAWLYSQAGQTVSSFVGVPVQYVLADAENMGAADRDFPSGGIVNFLPPPWVEQAKTPLPEPPQAGDAPILGNWRINLAGKINTMTFTKAIGKWAGPLVFQSGNYVVQQKGNGVYVHYPRSTPEGVVAFKLEGVGNLIEYYQGKPFRTWMR